MKPPLLIRFASSDGLSILDGYSLNLVFLFLKLARHTKVWLIHRRCRRSIRRGGCGTGTTASGVVSENAHENAQKESLKHV